MLIDTHAHLDMEDFEPDLEEVLKRAREGGVGYVITVGTDLSSSQEALKLAGRHDFISSTLGYHPHHAKDLDQDHLNELAELAADPKIVAWGEIGLDFFRRRSPVNRQMEAFIRQLDLAWDLGLPVIIHCRDAHKELIEILTKRKVVHRGVIHCFSGDYDLAMTYIDMGYHISIPGTVTYKNAGMTQEVASRIPLECLLLETDAPFLTPVPLRGKRNEPLFTTHTAKKIADLRGMDLEDLARQTSKNAAALFNLPINL
ncbi:MAG: TatD family hydrolase [Proteobacteria bacterium]|nr:TatD family hydrolase [Pseudomonadota bacterium]